MFSYSPKEMFQACSAVKERFPMLSVIAIPWLTNPREMVNRIESKTMQPTFILMIARMGLCLLRGFQWASLIGYFRLKRRKELTLLKKKSFVGVAKTWFTHKEEQGDPSDFYLGDLQKRLKTRGLSLLLLSGNVTCKGWASFCERTSQTGELSALPDLCLVSPWHPLWMMCCQIGVSFLLFGASLFEKDQLCRRVLKLASCDCMRSQTTFNALNFWIGKLSTRIWKQKFFITLYEGHGWEQCLWRGVRGQDPACKIIGYQHTVIMNHNFETRNPRVSRHEKTTPDIVLTIGHRGCEILKAGHAKFGTKIIPFGSFRYSSKMGELKEPDEKRQAILVIPEGIWEEALFLFESIAKAASILKDRHFILRCHPVLPFHRVSPHLKKDPTKLSNVELSDRHFIEDDFSRSAVAIYRGSSAILYSILKGLKPFYLNSPFLKMIDPLFELKVWKEYVDSLELLPEKIQDFYSMPLKEKIASWQTAADYVQGYTIPVDEKSMDQLLTAIQ